MWRFVFHQVQTFCYIGRIIKINKKAVHKPLILNFPAQLLTHATKIRAPSFHPEKYLSSLANSNPEQGFFAKKTD